MRRRKEDYLLIGFAIVLITIVGIITLVALQQGNSPTQPQQIAPSPAFSPTIAPTAQTNPPVSYDTQAQKKLLNNVLNRQQLITTDTTAKQQILTLLPQGQDSGTLYSSENVQIEYIHGPDLFQAEILTTNIVEAKTEATAWFRKQGMSQEGICKLPLMFYLNWNVANLLRDTHITFSPLPSNC
jgi:hypothetical protein